MAVRAPYNDAISQRPEELIQATLAKMHTDSGRLQRAFHSVSILGLTCVIMATWEAIFSTGTFSLINGGRSGTVWLYIATWILTIPVSASLAEMASM